ncbi:protein O-mannosyl-transferase TMEM260-like [Haliotis cracherodii]|uniref:protein O-mannosyl-transferase TMEM260-like n=1 Tax=Haliotis cracherodii TaxID=6455 RepID=UPI0039EAB62F
MAKAMKKKKKDASQNQLEASELKLMSPLNPRHGKTANCRDSVVAVDVLSSLWKPVTVAVVVFGVYLQTLHPSLPGGDSGELIVAASEFGVAHPPGYPLFTVLAQCMLEFFPFGNPAWRINLLTALTSAVVAGVLFVVVERLTCWSSAGVLAVAVFSFSRLTWTWAVTAEVFALNNLFVALLMMLAVMFEQSQGNKTRLRTLALLGSFCCGLSLCNQHTCVLYIVCVVPWAFTILYTAQALTVGMVLKLSVTMCLGLLPYVYLPVSAYTRAARWTWGDQRTTMGFVTHLLRMEYGTFDLLKDHTGQGLIYGLRLYLEHIYTDLTPVGYLLAIFSVIAAVKRLSQQYKSSSVCIFYLMLFTYIVFFGWRANLDVKNPLLLGVVERFWMQSDIVVAVLAAVTFVDFINMVHWLIDLHKWRLDLIFAVAVAVFQLHRNFPLCDQSTNYVVRDFAVSLLNSLPNGSIILTKGDLPSNTLRYFHLCENVRPDIILFDQEVLTYKWSVEMMRDTSSGLLFPGDFMQLKDGMVEDGRTSFTFRSLLDANIQRRPMFGCIGVQDHEPSWRSGYELWPYGVCSQFIQKGSTLDLSTWINNTKNIGVDWKHPHTGYPPTSWEHVATGEMWAAMTASAFFLLDKSGTYKDGPEKTAMLLYSFQLYREAHRQHKSVPSYWHKNFALVSERLFQTDTDLDKAELLKISIKQFRLYLKKEPADPDKDKIKTAVASLQKYLDQLKSVL